jgi:hypothetical protein
VIVVHVGSLTALDLLRCRHVTPLVRSAGVSVVAALLRLDNHAAEGVERVSILDLTLCSTTRFTVLKGT